MPKLHGKTVAIVEARRAKELSELIAKLGGKPYVASAMREVYKEGPEAVAPFIRLISQGRADWMVFLTGVGARALFEAAEGLGLKEGFIQALQRMTVVARGPKPIAVLRGLGVRIDIIPAEPTSEGILKALEGRDLRGKVVVVQLYGEPNPFLTDGLRMMGAEVLEVQPYEWDLPLDEGPVVNLIRDVIAGQIDILAITSAPQVKNLFAIATRHDLAEALAQALREKVLVAAVGPISERALKKFGVSAWLVSEKNTMGALIVAIAEALERQEMAKLGEGGS